MRIAALLIALCLYTTPAMAATSLSVSPVRADLSTKAPIASIALNNAGDQDMVMEATIHAWSQDSLGKWHLAPTQNVRVYPPQVTVPAKGEAFVRVGLEGAPGPGAYRLELRELVDHADLKSGAVRILTRISLPVFVPPASAQQSISAKITARVVGGMMRARVENTGNMTLVPQEWAVMAGTLTGHLPGYVLPGGAFEWSAPMSGCKNGDQLKLVSDRATLSAPIQGCQ